MTRKSRAHRVEFARHRIVVAVDAGWLATHDQKLVGDAHAARQFGGQRTMKNRHAFAELLKTVHDRRDAIDTTGAVGLLADPVDLLNCPFARALSDDERPLDRQLNVSETLMSSVQLSPTLSGHVNASAIPALPL